MKKQRKTIKLRSRVNKVDQGYGVQIQLFPRGRWLQRIDCSDSPIVFEEKEEAELVAFLEEKGPRFKRWFKNNYTA